MIINKAELYQSMKEMHVVSYYAFLADLQDAIITVTDRSIGVEKLDRIFTELLKVKHENEKHGA